MRQVYYSINRQRLEELKDYLKDYKDLTRASFSKDKTKEEKVQILEKKNEIRLNIEKGLKDHGYILGYFTEGQISELDESINNVSKEDIRKKLKTNCIFNEDISHILVELNKDESNPSIQKLVSFLESSKEYNSDIIVWII